MGRLLSAVGRLEERFGAAFAPLVAAAATLFFVIPTLAPGVLDWDTAEFQTVGPVLGTAHPTGYPAYAIIGWLASIVLQPFGDPAYRMNLLQAFFAAGAVAGTVAVVQHLSGMRWVALATGLLFLTMPLATGVGIQMPVASFSTGPTLWSISTHADPHLFHLALVTLLFLLLLIWDDRRHGDDRAQATADRWLIGAAFVFGVAVANHSLALLLPPAIGLFLIAVAPRIVLQWRLILTCALVLLATAAVLFAELPIRAAMNAPLVYGRPDTLGGFAYVVLGEQFRGSLIDPFGDLPEKYALVMSALAAWLGPLSFLAAAGIGSSLIRRPRYVLLAGTAALISCWFAASYANADISRYFLVPLFVAYTFVGLGLADLVTLVAWAFAVVARPAGGEEGDLAPDDDRDADEAGDERPTEGFSDEREDEAYDEEGEGPYRLGPAWLYTAVEIAAAVVIIAGCLAVVPRRQQVPSAEHPGGVSLVDRTYPARWLHAVLAPPADGGLPEDSVVVSWWSASTLLWYGQRVERLRPDIYIVDDRTRQDDDLGSKRCKEGNDETVCVWDVIDRFLGERPVFLIRMAGGPDGMSKLGEMYDLAQFELPDGSTITQVISKKGSP